jgi:hypothetical protein
LGAEHSAAYNLLGEAIRWRGDGMRAPRSAACTWGSTADERALAFACNRFLPDADAVYFRATTARAAAPTLFRWLCQLRAAPYSYDLLDNGGRRSPRSLIPGLERLEVGQRVMRIFTLVDFEPDEQITLVMSRPDAVRLFGEVAVTYLIVPHGERACRLVAKLRVRYPRRGAARAMRWILPWGDALMMRKQLHTLAHLAERTERSGASGGAAGRGGVQ